MIPRSIAREPGNWQMNLENSWLPSQSKRLVGNARRISLLLVLISSHLVGGPSGSAQIPAKKNVLILNEVGPSHALTKLVAQELFTGVPDTPGRHVEFYSESFDMLSFPDSLSASELHESLVIWQAKI
jgi:hypothetical protein